MKKYPQITDVSIISKTLFVDVSDGGCIEYVGDTDGIWFHMAGSESVQYGGTYIYRFGDGKIVTRQVLSDLLSRYTAHILNDKRYSKNNTAAYTNFLSKIPMR